MVLMSPHAHTSCAWIWKRFLSTCKRIGLKLYDGETLSLPLAVAKATAFAHVSSRRWEDFWEVSERARDALWEVFLSASEQLFRQLVLRRTLTLSSSQLLNPLLHLPFQLVLPLSRSSLLFTDLFPEGALTDGDGGFAVASSDKCFLFTDASNTVEGAHRPPSPAFDRPFGSEEDK